MQISKNATEEDKRDMNWIETIAARMRHLPGLRRLEGVWGLLRPFYQRGLRAYAGQQGLTRVMNGMDAIRILPECRWQPEVYEPEVWRRLLPAVRAGDRIADVGAHFGLYAVAFAKRTGPTGQVLAVEADAECMRVLKAHLELNKVEAVVKIVPQALSDRAGETVWHSQSEQSVLKPGLEGGRKVIMTTLDALIPDGRLDLMLVDIEGHEEPALRGGARLLSDPARRPRMIVIEVHPYNWHLCGGSSDSLVSFMRGCGYRLRHLDGSEVREITEYGHVVADMPAP